MKTWTIDENGILRIIHMAYESAASTVETMGKDDVAAILRKASAQVTLEINDDGVLINFCIAKKENK